MNVRPKFFPAVLGCLLWVAATAPAQDTRDTPQVELDLPSFTMDVVCVFAQDMVEVRTDLYIHLLYDRLTFIKDKELFRSEVDIAVTVLDSAGTARDEKTWTETIESRNYEETVTPGAGRMLQRSFLLLPGKYTFVVQCTDADTRKATRTSRPVVVRDLAPAPVSVSDILLVRSMKTDGPRAVVTPNISANVGESVSGFDVFVEVYRDGTVDSVELIPVVRTIEGNPVGRDTVYKALTKVRTACFLTIPTRNIAPGPYTLTIEARPLRMSDEGRERGAVTGASRTFFVRLRGLPVSILDIDRAIDQLQYIADRDIIDALKALPPDQKKDQFLAFWKRKDPLSSTEQNELMEEYYTRIDYANKSFGHYQEGWRTDRGMVYVVFGPPNNIERHPFDIDAKPYEIWTYYSLNRNFIFVDYNGFGDYRLQNPIWDTWVPRNR